MIIPVRCFSCSKPIGHLWEEYKKRVDSGEDAGKVLDELGLDYVQLLYQQPTQILPILCLVSKKNETGKTTFAKWLKVLLVVLMVYSISYPRTILILKIQYVRLIVW